MMINRQPPSFPDVEIFDPIHNEAYSGYQTYCETGTDYAKEIAVYGDGSRLLHYVHKIAIPKRVTLTKGHPFVIRSTSSDIQLFGVLAGFQAEMDGRWVITKAEYGATGEPDSLSYSTQHY